MAIRPYYFDNEGPPCALKIGPVNCFCVWDQSERSPLDQNALNRESTSLTITPPPPQIPIKDYAEADGEGNGRTHDNPCDLLSIENGGVGASGTESSAIGGPIGDGNFLDNPLLAVVRLQAGHLPLVRKELQEIESIVAKTGIDTAALEKLRRLVTQHRIDVRNAGWPLHHDRRDGNFLEYGAKVSDGLCQWFRTSEFDGCDVVKGLAALLEVDLAGGFSEEVKQAEPLGVHTARREAIWRVLTESAFPGSHHHKRQENVWSYGTIDALDEPIGSLVIFAHSPPEHRVPGPSVSLLAAQQLRGLKGVDLESIIHCIEPLWSSTTKGEAVGFRLTQTGVSKLPAAVSSPYTLKVSDGDMHEHELFQDRLMTYLTKAKQLDSRMRMSPRTELYDRIRRHLVKADPRLKPPPKPAANAT